MDLPQPPEPAGDYQGVIVRNGIGFVSGQFPLQNGALGYSGVIGTDLSEEDAREAMKITARNVLAHISNATESFRELHGILRLEGHLACSDSFANYVSVLDEASKIFNEHLGEKGRHTRALFVHSRLPLDSPIELCVSFCDRTI